MHVTIHNPCLEAVNLLLFSFKRKFVSFQIIMAHTSHLLACFLCSSAGYKKDLDYETNKTCFKLIEVFPVVFALGRNLVPGYPERITRRVPRYHDRNLARSDFSALFARTIRDSTHPPLFSDRIDLIKTIHHNALLNLLHLCH